MREPPVKRAALQRRGGRQTFCHGLVLVVATLSSRSVLSGKQDVTEPSLDVLVNTEATSVAHKNQPLATSVVAVFVINQEMLRHAGATSIPELLRLAAGLNVGQQDRSSHNSSGSPGFD